MKKIVFIASLFLLPSVALADVTNITSLISMLQSIINALVPLLMGFALIGFMVGVIRYIWAAGNPSKIKEARGFIAFSIVAMAVMLSIWSITLFVHDSFFPSSPAGINFGGGSSGTQITGNSGGNTPTEIINGGGQDLGECNTLQGPLPRGSSCSGGGMCDNGGNCIPRSDSSYCNLLGVKSVNLACTQSDGTDGVCSENGDCVPIQAATH